MSELRIGTSAFANASDARLREAGIDWIRVDIPQPFQDRLGGELTGDYLKAREEARSWAARGFKVMGVSPLVGIGGYKADAAGNLAFVWKDFMPAWMGALNDPLLTRNYREVCAFLAQDLRGAVQMWQISNELNIPLFAGTLTPYNACEMLLEGAAGLKEGDSSLVVGPNSAMPSLRYYFYGRLFADPRRKYLDYCGIDGYIGTWDPGSPEDWHGLLTELADMVRVPILINEWGYSSAGGILAPGELTPGAPICQYKKWQYGWDSGHTPAVQGEFVRRAMQVFYEHRSALLGAFFYRWEDQEACWQCGEPDCPAETARGLVDLHGSPKPAFYAHQEGIARLKS